MDLSRISKPRYVDPIREGRGLIRLHARRSCAGHISSESAMIASARHSNSLLLFALYYQSRSIHHVAAGNYRKGKFVIWKPPNAQSPTSVRAANRATPADQQLSPVIPPVCHPAFSIYHDHTDGFAINMSDLKATGGGSKSRTGCSECKRKRVKCDEGKPSCGRCKRYPERCSYELKLSWTQGRPFKKPRTKEPWLTNLDGEAATSKSDPPRPVPVPQNEPETIDHVVPTTFDESQSLQNADNDVTQDLDVGNSNGKSRPQKPSLSLHHFSFLHSVRSF